MFDYNDNEYKSMMMILFKSRMSIITRFLQTKFFFDCLMIFHITKINHSNKVDLMIYCMRFY